LDEALNLREKDPDFVAYRRCYLELRNAWAKGTHDEERERDVLDVTRELTKRYPEGNASLDNQPVWSREIGIKETPGAEAGVKGGTLVPSVNATAKAEIEADFGNRHVTQLDSERARRDHSIPQSSEDSSADGGGTAFF
jgi:hypothetical protein